MTSCTYALYHETKCLNIMSRMESLQLIQKYYFEAIRNSNFSSGIYHYSPSEAIKKCFLSLAITHQKIWTVACCKFDTTLNLFIAEIFKRFRAFCPVPWMKVTVDWSVMKEQCLLPPSCIRFANSMIYRVYKVAFSPLISSNLFVDLLISMQLNAVYL